MLVMVIALRFRTMPRPSFTPNPSGVTSSFFCMQRLVVGNIFPDIRFFEVVEVERFRLGLPRKHDLGQCIHEGIQVGFLR